MESKVSDSEFSRTQDELGRYTGGISNEQLAAQITELAGHLNAANHRLLVLIAEFDRRGGWSDGLTQSCAHWLNWKCGIGLCAAREKVRVGHALAQLPHVSAAMARGELSYSKVRAITRVANASTDEYFLEIARHGTAWHVEKLVRHWRDVREVAELTREEQQQRHRALRYHWERDGSLTIRAQLPAEVGTIVLKALERAMEDIPLPQTTLTPDERAAGYADDRPTCSMRQADALVIVAESFLARGAESLNGGDRQQIVVHVDAQTLIERTAGRCEIDDGPSVAAETARRLACDASLVTIVEDEHGEPLDVGRRTRTIPPALRRALASRDKGCRFPGCTHVRYVDRHHVRHWADGGETKLSNLVSLCRFHHRAVHEGRLVVERLDDGAWRFSKPNGESLVGVLPLHTQPLIESDWQRLVAENRALGFEITPRTAATRWQGERMDFGTAIDALISRSKLAGTWPPQRRHDSAESSQLRAAATHKGGHA
jgi:hypothetical protein